MTIAIVTAFIGIPVICVIVFLSAISDRRYR